MMIHPPAAPGSSWFFDQLKRLEFLMIEEVVVIKYGFKVFSIA
jgi:hypothetical protein